MYVVRTRQTTIDGVSFGVSNDLLTATSSHNAVLQIFGPADNRGLRRFHQNACAAAVRYLSFGLRSGVLYISDSSSAIRVFGLAGTLRPLPVSNDTTSVVGTVLPREMNRTLRSIHSFTRLGLPADGLPDLYTVDEWVLPSRSLFSLVTSL